MCIRDRYIGEFREMGYLPEALNNFLALLGWNPAVSYTHLDVYKRQHMP